MRAKVMAAVLATMLLPLSTLGQASVDQDVGLGVELSWDAGTDVDGIEPVPSDRAEPGLAAALDARSPADGPLRVIVQFHDQGIAASAGTLFPGLDVRYTFESLPAVVATGPPDVVRTLLEDPRVRYVERDHPVRFHLDSAARASRARDVYDASVSPGQPPLQDGGEPVDGSGVGVALLDTGVDATHPDLPYLDKVRRNMVATPAGVAEGGPYTVAGGHGTLMAGIVAGTGAASAAEEGPDYRGVAPGASLYSFQVGGHAAPNRLGGIAAASVAFDWILQHGDDQDPPIHVVSNAWSCKSALCRTFNPDRLHVRLASALAENGTVVLFAAGDGRGEGLVPRVNAEALNPTPGVLGVGDYDDEDFGFRSFCAASASAKGTYSDPSTWPDLVAPGTDTWTTNPVEPWTDTREPATGRKTYRKLPGLFDQSSAATSHMAGVVALMLDANPALSPGEVEFLAKNSTDPLSGCNELPSRMVRASAAHPWDPANYWVGHGLIDAYDAVAKAQAFDGLPDPAEAPPLEPLPEAWPTTDEAALGEPARTFYLTGEDGLTEERPGEIPHATLRVHRGEVLELRSFTSEPLESGFNTSAVEMDVWMGTTGEWDVLTHSFPVVRYRVERVHANGSTTVLLDDRDRLSHVPTGGPWSREEVALVDPPVRFEPGDRVRVSTGIGLRDDSVLAPVTGNWLLYADAHPTPSRVVLGTADKDVAPGSNGACQLTLDCAWIGGDRQVVRAECDFGDLLNHVVRWTGPPGSGVAFVCDGIVTSCTVPGQPGDPRGTCRAETPTRAASTGDGHCLYFTPDGRRVDGHGWCRPEADDLGWGSG